MNVAPTSVTVAPDRKRPPLSSLRLAELQTIHVADAGNAISRTKNKPTIMRLITRLLDRAMIRRTIHLLCKRRRSSRRADTLEDSDTRRFQFGLLMAVTVPVVPDAAGLTVTSKDGERIRSRPVS